MAKISGKRRVAGKNRAVSGRRRLARIAEGRENGDVSEPFLDRVFYKSCERMSELPDASVHLAVTSPPYLNIKDYSRDGFQNRRHSEQSSGDVGALSDCEDYLRRLLPVWRECERVLKPNGKLCVNVPLMPIPKDMLKTHYNRHIYDLQSAIQHSILTGTGLFLLDLYIWNRLNSSKRLMFGSYPYPRNFYAQNTVEFVAVYVKDGRPENNVSESERRHSLLSQKEWVDFTRQIWDIPIPGRSDSAFGSHPAIMPEEIPYRCIRLYTFAGDVVLDPFAGSGTTLKMAKSLSRRFVGYELYPAYRRLIEAKLREAEEVELFAESAD